MSLFARQKSGDTIAGWLDFKSLGSPFYLFFVGHELNVRRVAEIVEAANIVKATNIVGIVESIVVVWHLSIVVEKSVAIVRAPITCRL